MNSPLMETVMVTAYQCIQNTLESDEAPDRINIVKNERTLVSREQGKEMIPRQVVALRRIPALVAARA